MSNYVTDAEIIKKTYFFAPHALLVQQQFTWNPNRSWVDGVPVNSELTAGVIALLDAALASDENDSYVFDNAEAFIRRYGQELYDARLPLDDKTVERIVHENTGRNLMAEAKAKLINAFSEAEAVADKYELSFSIDPAYGMGGTYDGEDGEWCPSSQSC